MLRVNAVEKQQLLEVAGEVGISAYVRARLFGGGVRNRDGLRKIAALHVVGRRIQSLAENPGVDRSVIVDALAAVRLAISSLVGEVPEQGDDGI